MDDDRQLMDRAKVSATSALAAPMNEAGGGVIGRVIYRGPPFGFWDY
jgi:hypothetical protein